MKKRLYKTVAVIVGLVMTFCCFFSLVGCASGKNAKERLDSLARRVTQLFMGNNIFNWNAFSVDPENSFGYEEFGEPSWYSYSALSKSDAGYISLIMRNYKNELSKIKISALEPSDAATYRAMESMLAVQADFYGSDYVEEFDLFGGDYISSEGGYVADFASSCENFIFRNASDVQKLLEVTKTTKEAFDTYDDFAKDRLNAGYPLADSTILGMQDYLNSVSDKGDEYYLYDVLYSKIDAADFLTDNQKSDYKKQFKSALDNKFMPGVKTLARELDKYKGKLTKVSQAYLPSYGKAGKAYYEWLFYSRTGIKNANIISIYNELVDAIKDYGVKIEGIIAEADALEDTDKAAYDDFYSYYYEERALLDLTEPTAIIEYLIEAAKAIVPDLETLPEIGFKYMDETEAEVTSAVAYYVKSPLDEENSTEYITINPLYVGADTSSISTIAHEGYPGHLYAHVNAKENGESLISAIGGSIAFSEGWAQYAELKIIKNIAESSTDKAEKLYAEYFYYDVLEGYTNSVLNDMMINYFGTSVTDLILSGVPAESASEFIETMMELPAVYVPYGYGMHYLVKLHDKAQTELGDKYSEIEFNRALLGDGFSVTLPRADDITKEYIKAAKAA